MLTTKCAAMQSNKISQLNSNTFRPKIITKQLTDFTVLVPSITFASNHHGLRGKSKQKLEYYWENVGGFLLKGKTTESMTANQASDLFLHEGSSLSFQLT